MVTEDESCALCGATWGNYRAEIGGQQYHF